jgi:DNA recombination protein RmuC
MVSDPIILIAGGAVLLILVLLVVLVFVLLGQVRRVNRGSSAEAVQRLADAMQREQSQLATLNARVAHLEPLSGAVQSMQVETRTVAERISMVEQGQQTVHRGVGVLANHSASALSELKTLTNGLAEATASMRAELARAKSDLTALQSSTHARQEADLAMAESLRRLEMVIAGTHSKGSAGENILELVFAKLPPAWQVRNFKVDGKPVEFALRLPNDLVLPIDSKWPATHLMEQFAGSEDPSEQQRIKKEIETAVLLKAREVRKYVDPAVTVNFGVAVVPDSVYDLCYGIQADVFQLGVVLVSYSMFVPYLLLVFQTMLKASQGLDVQRLEAYLHTVQASIQAMQEELDGRFSRAITMLSNSRDDMRAHLSKAGSSAAGLRLGNGAEPDDGLDEDREMGE